MRGPRGLGFVAALTSSSWLTLSGLINGIDGAQPAIHLSKAQMASANLTGAIADAINEAVQFERSNWATGSVRTDPFYTVDGDNASSSSSSSSSSPPPGTVIKLEASTNTSQYDLAPGLALSRLVYQSLDFDGSRVPVSAFVLWPYRARDGRERVPLVAWAHGTAGVVPECAPSHLKNLFAQFSSPYALALAGFAVVATDFAGLGVAAGASGVPIQHRYLVASASGNDLLYSARAAQAAFPRLLTDRFAVIGHSQGGGAAWAAAERQLLNRVPGYLGAVVVAPVINPIELATYGSKVPLEGLFKLARTVASQLGNISLSALLTSQGLSLLRVVENLGGCNSVWSAAIDAITRLDAGRALFNETFLRTADAEHFGAIAAVGSKDFAGPMLVPQGTNDDSAPENLTTSAVEKTCAAFPDRPLHYVRAEAMTHDSILYATQHLWLDWLDRRFLDSSSPSESQGRCSREELGAVAPRPLQDYKPYLTYYLMHASEQYLVA